MATSPFMNSEKYRVQRFMIIGPINALISFLSFWIALSIFERTLVSIVIATGCGWAFSYMTNKKFVWSSNKRVAHPIRFIVLQSILILINWALLRLVFSNINISQVVAQAFLIPFLAISSFIGSEYWIYPKESKTQYV